MVEMAYWKFFHDFHDYNSSEVTIFTLVASVEKILMGKWMQA